MRFRAVDLARQAARQQRAFLPAQAHRAAQIGAGVAALRRGRRVHAIR